MINSTLETVLRRDRLVVAGALGVIAALAWGYVLWLAVDMDMGGMDMPEFRMIPAGLGLMAPLDAPWGVIEFAFVFVMWASTDWQTLQGRRDKLRAIGRLAQQVRKILGKQYASKYRVR